MAEACGRARAKHVENHGCAPKPVFLRPFPWGAFSCVSSDSSNRTLVLGLDRGGGLSARGSPCRQLASGRVVRMETDLIVNVLPRESDTSKHRGGGMLGGKGARELSDVPGRPGPWTVRHCTPNTGVLGTGCRSWTLQPVREHSCNTLHAVDVTQARCCACTHWCRRYQSGLGVPNLHSIGHIHQGCKSGATTLLKMFSIYLNSTPDSDSAFVRF